MVSLRAHWPLLALGLALPVAADPGGEIQAQGVGVGVAAHHDQVAASMSGTEKVAATKAALEKMRGILTRVIKHLEESREERDLVKLNCVNEKLTAIKGLLKISEQADVTLQESLARNNMEAANHEFGKIQIAQQKCEILMAESEACIGELAVYSGDTEVEIVIEDDVSGDDPTEDLTEVDIITRPPAASPFQ